jgi:hypothetical protein
MHLFFIRGLTIVGDPKRANRSSTKRWKRRSIVECTRSCDIRVRHRQYFFAVTSAQRHDGACGERGQCAPTAEAPTGQKSVLH